MPPKKIAHFSPGRIILLSVLAAICIGTILLLLPISRRENISIIDIFFTATSVTCVTGLLTVPLSSFTPFGQVVIMCLMQIGGLGLITMTIFILSVFVQLGLTTQLLAGQMLELESWKNIRSLLLFIIQFTFALELLGAIGIFFSIWHDFPLEYGFFYSFFHAISSFCDAGFTLFPNGLIPYNRNILLLTITAILMFSGGLGFITWHEIMDYIKAMIFKKRRFFSLYTKIVLSTSFSLIFSTSVLYWILERNNAFHAMNPFIAFCNTVFNAIASRSTGFITVHPTELQVATLFVVMIIAFIGSSPGSTGSGIKTTTFAIFLATVHAAISGRTTVQIKGRRIARDQVYKALAVISLSLAWIILTIFCLLITERSWEFFDIVFEVISAFATLGLSTGITPYLSVIGKLFIMTTMIIGRIGSLTIILALRKKRAEKQEYQYPEERVMLG
ncbi:MAG: potassium transporter TrkG [Candidatus Babeliales bacterium]